MSNDGGYSARFDDPKKACVNGSQIRCTEIKLWFCELVQGFTFDTEWTEKARIKFWRIQKWNKIIPWFKPDIESRFALMKKRDGGRGWVRVSGIEACLKSPEWTCPLCFSSEFKRLFAPLEAASS